MCRYVQTAFRVTPQAAATAVAASNFRARIRSGHSTKALPPWPHVGPGIGLLLNFLTLTVPRSSQKSLPPRRTRGGAYGP